MNGNTQSGLKAGYIENTLSGKKVHFHFNPFKFSINKSNKWKEKSGKGTNVPPVDFEQGGAQTLTVQLHFDSQSEGSDVRAFTAPLWAMMMVDDSTRNSSSNKSQPPPVVFSWNRLYFKSVITKLSEDFELFSATGIPLRSKVKITLRQYVDENETPPQVGGMQMSNPNTPQTTTTMQGDRPDNTANAANGSSNWRTMATQNNVDNPLNVPPGSQMNTSRS